MKFAFLVHPLTHQMRQLIELNREGNFQSCWGKDLISFLSNLERAVNVVDDRIAARDPDQVFILNELPNLVSAAGSTAEGRLYEIPMLAHEILNDPQQAIYHMQKAADHAHAWGAQLIGLGSMTGIVGGRGQHLAENTEMSVTTGNSLTVYAALRNLDAACIEADIDLSEENIAVVGIPGSIASAVARILASKCKSLMLVARQNSVRSQRLCDELDAEFTCEIQTALKSCRIVVSATSSGNCISQDDLQPGSIVVDVAVPTDVVGGTQTRDDCLILNGGLTRIPDSMSVESSYFWFQRGMIPSCLGETTVLALENQASSYSLGQDLCIEKIQRIGAVAEKHGFDFSKLVSFGSAIEDQALIRFRKATKTTSRVVFDPKLPTAAPQNGFYQNGSENGNGVHQEDSFGSGNGHANGVHRAGTNGKHLENGNGTLKTAQTTTQQLAHRARKLFARHINPVLTEIGGDIVKTIVRGENCHIWDDQGNKYLDFVSGFGSVNVGHNHPEVVSALKGVLEENAPGFIQSSINPLTTALAERLITISPDSLEFVFFGNSGTEAVEAALKTARVATGRSAIVYCEGSYHGKSLGSLSVTGNERYKTPFGPLLPDCISVPFGDLERLAEVLSQQKCAAFIVEPVQAEGGMIVPPVGYLKSAAELCQESGALFICDEIQTGLGRTGSMFACEEEGLSPDIMTLAKSLSGGAVPVGATLYRREVWQSAYGTADSFALHTSTFGGGSLASAAGIASLSVIEDENLAANAQKMGARLRDGLDEIARECDLVKDVRGSGLLLGVEFKPLYDSVVKHWKNVDQSMLKTFLGQRLDEVLSCIPSLYVMNTLLNKHGIMTQTARSNPLVVRIQPPLTITESQVDQFLTAFKAASKEIEFTSTLVDSMFSRTTLGDHAEKQTTPSH